MIDGQRRAVVLPAYNAARTLAATVRELPDDADGRRLSTMPSVKDGRATR
jgi:hypothetical protein